MAGNQTKTTRKGVNNDHQRANRKEDQKRKRPKRQDKETGTKNWRSPIKEIPGTCTRYSDSLVGVLDASNHIFALRIHKELTHDLLLTGVRVTSEAERARDRRKEGKKKKGT